MNKFSDMTTFVTVVDAASFSEAARRLGTTKSIVSERIQQLEKRLGCALLERGRPLRMTQAGLVFYESAARVLEDVERAEESVQDAQSSLGGTFRIAVPMAFMTRHLAPLLSKFAMMHPNLCLDVEAQDRVVSLQDGQYDMAIRMGELSDSSLVARTITVNRHLICASPAYLERQGTPAHPGELAQHAGLVYYNREPNGMWSLPLDGRRQSFRIGTRMRTDSGHLLLEGARAGLGLAILPTFLAAGPMLAGELVAVLQAYSPSGGQISAVYRKTVRTPPKIHVLIDFLADEIGHPSRWDAELMKAGLIGEHSPAQGLA
ncbi:LysR family transcriptional regulator [Paraburkholderia guartelaensis]|uniref:LysR family transcriptional regulator n=1 Tax=Paraburkholderia guartelaensis TaxID=2546446 RepID=A0A4R5LBC1_9BURK|nr:LysR family transcriptional regulator [Paraburkholderia guartelaensis]TDG06562.1 LysR family transcriptional regulator [Paraburkholderia guartelaensis]